MKKLMTLFATTMLFSSIASASNTKYILDLDELSKSGETSAIQMVKNGDRSSYKYCEVELDSQNAPLYDCSTQLGSSDGYTNEQLDQYLKEVQEENVTELKIHALTLAATVLNYRLSVKRMTANQIKKMQHLTRINGKEISLTQTLINYKRGDYILGHATFFIFAGLGQELMYNTARKKEKALNQIKFLEADQLISVANFDVDTTADFLSRTLK